MFLLRTAGHHQRTDKVRRQRNVRSYRQLADDVALAMLQLAEPGIDPATGRTDGRATDVELTGEFYRVRGNTAAQEYQRSRDFQVFSAQSRHDSL